MEDLKETKSDEVLGAIREYFTNEELDDLPVALTKNYLEDSLSGAFLCPEPDFMKNKKKLLENNAADLDDEKCVKPTSVAPKRKKVKTMLPVKISPERIAPNKKSFKGEQPPEGRYISSLDDNPVPIGLKDRAKKTVPKGILEVRPSQIHGFGVFAVRNLNIGVWLGPYEGSVTTIDAETGYAWKLRNGKLEVRSVLDIHRGITIYMVLSNLIFRENLEVE
nr:uncharacterized protein LOC111506287 [Leptinotarsa decemlineata]